MLLVRLYSDSMRCVGRFEQKEKSLDSRANESHKVRKMEDLFAADFWADSEIVCKGEGCGMPERGVHDSVDGESVRRPFYFYSMWRDWRTRRIYSLVVGARRACAKTYLGDMVQVKSQDKTSASFRHELLQGALLLLLYLFTVILRSLLLHWPALD